jgi:hypothetical protein
LRAPDNGDCVDNEIVSTVERRDEAIAGVVHLTGRAFGDCHVLVYEPFDEIEGCAVCVIALNYRPVEIQGVY